MDALDNLIYSTLNPCTYPNGFQSLELQSDFDLLTLTDPVGATLPSAFNTSTNVASYHPDTRQQFVTLDNTDVIEDAIKKHWFDIAQRISYTTDIGLVDQTGNTFPMFTPPVTAIIQAYTKFNTPPYHLIFSYLVENTRITQIFEKMLSMYIHDEKLTKTNNIDAFRWIFNTETLFYATARSANRRNTISQLRPVSEATRRNAYQRMFGMDLAFGDLNNSPYTYTKAEFANSSFISLFETFLIEFWRGFTNANNTSGQNSTDTEHLEDLARRLQELLMSRRTTNLTFDDYRYFNLSMEEYSSYVFLYWLFYIISFDSPVVDYLNCNANTPGDRLINIGRKVGLPAHTKSVAILDIAQPMNLILRGTELGLFNNSEFLQRVIRALSTINPPNPAPTTQEKDILNNMLIIINNWEKATGHRIKNPEANITGIVKVQQNGAKAQPVMN